MKAVLLITCLFFCNYSWTQNDAEETLLKKLSDVSDDTVKAEIYMQLHNAVFKQDLSKSKRYAQKIIEYGKKGNSLKMMQVGYSGLARCERKKRNYNAVYQWDTQIIQLAKKINDPSNLLTTHLTMARDYLDDDKPKKALPYLNECKRLAAQINDPSASAKVNQTFGWYYFKQNQFSSAISAYKNALAAYVALNDQRMIAETRYIMTSTYISMRETDSIPSLIFDALNFYKATGSSGRQGDCYALLAQAYAINGNNEKAIETYKDIINFYKETQNKINEGLANVDLASFYLQKKDFEKADKYGAEAERLLTEMQYQWGLITLLTFRGRYHSALEHNEQAEASFRAAENMAIFNDLPELQIENKKYWSEHRYRAKNYKGGDSMVFLYVKQLSATKNEDALNKELATLLLKNRELDKRTIAMLKMLYKPGGGDSLQRILGGHSLSEVMNIDNVLSLNPYSLGSEAYDSSVVVADNKQLIAQETKYKTKLISDSLVIEKQNGIIAKEAVKRRNGVLGASFAGLLLLSSGFWLQYRNRKRAEKDKAKIELLQNEIHHRVKNNLGVIRRLIDVAGTSGSDSVSLQSLQSRVTAIELLHKRLYNENITGNISLQQYLVELTSAIQNTFEPNKRISMNVNTPVTISSKAAEKIGLITNELITNSYKYAFDEGDAGAITIEAKAAQADQYEIKIADNGKGMPPAARKNYGMRLISGLAHELNGSFSFENENGTRFVLQFTDNVS